MGQVVSAFRRSLGIATDAPVHSLLVLVCGISAAAVSLVTGLVPLVGMLVNGIVVTPLLLTGLLGSADAARLGESPADGFRDGVSAAGWNVVGAYALLTALWIGLAILLTVFVVAAALVAGMDEGALTGAGDAVVAGIALLAVATVVLAALAVQFVAPSAVVARTDAVESIKTSYRFFRRNPLGVFGFGLVAATFSVVALLLTVGLALLGQAIGGETLGLVLGGIGYFVAGVEVSSVFTVYMVTYFAVTVTDADLPDDHEWPDEAGTDTGAFSVGDVSTARPGTDADTSAGDPPTDTDGFHVEMANEPTGREGTDDTSWGTTGPENDETSRNGWDVDESDDSER